MGVYEQRWSACKVSDWHAVGSPYVSQNAAETPLGSHESVVTLHVLLQLFLLLISSYFTGFSVQTVLQSINEKKHN